MATGSLLSFASRLSAKSISSRGGMPYLSGQKPPLKLPAAFKMVDTCAAEFEAQTPYFYATFDEENEAMEFIKKKSREGSPPPEPAGRRRRRAVYMTVLCNPEGYNVISDICQFQYHTPPFLL